MSLIKVSLAAMLMALSVAKWFDYEGEPNVLSVGPAGVWAINSAGKIYYNEGTRNNADAFSQDNWSMLQDGELSQLDVGTDIVWGVNIYSQIFYRANITDQHPKGLAWRRVDGHFSHVTVSPRGNVWAVNANDQIYYRSGVTSSNPGGTTWRIIHGRFIQVSAGDAGVWAVNSNGGVYYRTGTYGDTGSSGSGWERIEEDLSLKYISSGNSVVGVEKNTGNICVRLGTNETLPLGTMWVQLPGVHDTVDTYSTTVFTTHHTST